MKLASAASLLLLLIDLLRHRMFTRQPQFLIHPSLEPHTYKLVQSLRAGEPFGAMDVMNGATRREISPRGGTSAVLPLLLSATPFLIKIKEEFQMVPEKILETKERKLHHRTIRNVLVQRKGYPIKDASWEDWDSLITQLGCNSLCLIFEFDELTF